MEWNPPDGQKRFRKRLLGLDPKEVQIFVQQANGTIESLRTENASQRKQLNEQEKELKEYREREKTIRGLLLNAHKAVEQMKANADKEARLIVAEAELQAEKVLQGAQQRLAQLHEDIAELKRQRIQLEMKLRSTIETYQQILDMDKEDEEESNIGSKVKFLNR